MTRTCKNCEVILSNRYKKVYCGNKCQFEYLRMDFIRKWKAGAVTGERGKKTRCLSGHIRTHLIEVGGEKCSQCGWDKRNPITGKVPLDIDHIDGNSENNIESNLRLMCPNCHSLTPFFRGLNRGKGRKWRMKILRNKNSSGE